MEGKMFQQQAIFLQTLFDQLLGVGNFCQQRNMISAAEAVDSLLQAISEDPSSLSSNSQGLNYFFGNKLITALDILDKNGCVCVTSKITRRRFWKVGGGTKANPENYLCYPHYCSCDYFIYTVMAKKDNYCKHQVAIFLGNALNRCVIEEMDDLEFGHLLSNM